METWLASGGENDGMVAPERIRKEARSSQKTKSEGSHGDREGPVFQPLDEEALGPMASPTARKRDAEARPEEKRKMRRPGPSERGALWLRRLAADVIEDALDSEDLAYALKLTVAVFLVSFPAFVASWNSWYSAARGVWGAAAAHTRL